MVSLAIGCAAVALVCWPPRRAAGRLSGLLAREGRRARPRRPGSEILGRPGPVALAVAGAGLGLLAAGPGGALASGLAALMAARWWRAGRQRRAHTEAAAGLADALELLVGELRVGAHPAAAALAAAADAEPAAARALTAAAATARLGGDVAAALQRCAAEVPTLGTELGRLAAAWALADEHGVGLAALVDAVRADLEARLRFAAGLHAQLAGPRASAAVLAGLPVLGVLLGQGVGADPWHVLSATVVGQVLLVLGVALTGVGLTWSRRIASGAGS